MKILIIRFSSIGDIVMTTPVIRCLKKQLNCTVHVATKKSFRSVLEHNPYVDKIHILEDSWNTFKADIEKEKFDHIIDLHNNLRSRRLSRGFRPKVSRINKLSIQKEALIHLKINNLPTVHFAHRALEAALHLGIKDDNEGMDFFIPSKIELPANISSKYATLAIASAHATKNIPEETILKILDESPIPIIMLGGPSEKELGEKLQSLFPERHINTAGQASILQSAAYIRKSEYLISGDTGMLHIACALKVPTISIWGATIPEFGVYPYYGKYKVKHHINEVKLSCRPCTKHGGPRCPKGHFHCMNQQDIPAILQQIKEI